MRTSTVSRWAPVVVGVLLPLLVASGSDASTSAEPTATSPVSGRAVDAVGAPVADVEVTASQQEANGSWDTVATGSTDADGRYSLELEPGTYRLLFEPPWAANLASEFWGGVFHFAFYPDEAPTFVVAGGAPVPDKDVALDELSTISGRVRTTVPGDSRPHATGYRLVDGEWVYANASLYDTEMPDGSYRIERVVPGTYRIHLSAGMGYLEQFWKGTSTVEEATDVTVSAGSTVAGIDGVVGPYGVITGRLVNGAGQGVANFGVHAEGESVNIAGRWKAETTTDARGYYTLSALPSARYTIRFGQLSGSCDQEYYHEQENDGSAEEIVIPSSSSTTVTIQAKTQRLTCWLEPTEEVRPFGFDPAQVGKPVGVVPPEFSVPGVEVTYQWYRIGTFPIPGATDFWYLPGFDDVPHLLRLRVTASRPGFHSTTFVFESNVYPGTIRSSTLPRIKGSPRVGETLRVTRGTWSPPDVSIRYTWLADRRPIPGAHGRKLTLLKRHLGKRISVRLVASVQDGSYLAREFHTRSTRPVTRR